MSDHDDTVWPEGATVVPPAGANPASVVLVFDADQIALLEDGLACLGDTSPRAMTVARRLDAARHKLVTDG